MYSPLRLSSTADRQAWQQPVHALLAEAYREVPGGLHYASADAMVAETQDWELLTHAGQLRAALLYKRKHGMKIVALAASADPDQRRAAVAGLGELLRRRLREAWIEVSGRAETFVLRHGGDLFRIPNTAPARGAMLTFASALAYHSRDRNQPIPQVTMAGRIALVMTNWPGDCADSAARTTPGWRPPMAWSTRRLPPNEVFHVVPPRRSHDCQRP